MSFCYGYGREGCDLKFQRSIWKSGVLGAIIIGSLTGLLGFGLFMGILFWADFEEGEISEQVDVFQEQPAVGDSAQFYALQHGVFSSHDAAAAFMKDFSQLNLAAVVEAEGQFYIWSKLSVEKGLPEQTVPTSFWKAVTIEAANCEQQATLLKELQALNQNNLVSKSEISKNVPNYWDPTLQAIGQLSSQVEVWRAHLVATDIEQKACLNLKF